MSRKKPVMSHDPLAEVGEEAAPAEQAAAPKTRRKRAPARKKTAAKKAAEPKPEVVAEQSADEPAATPEEAGDKVVLPGSITIMDVGELRAPLLQHLEGDVPLQIDGSEVESIEGAGVQLLAAFFKTANEKGIELSWVGASDSLRTAARQVGLDGYFKLDTDQQVA